MSLSSVNIRVLLGLGLAGILLIIREAKKVVKKDFGAFVERFEILPPPPPSPPKAPYPLMGLSFAVSDVFDIGGYIAGFGNPDWIRTHAAAAQISPVVSAVIEGGSTCVGKTVVDEMAYCVNGENKHYGTPTNPIAPARVPGGSSSGSAVAVASKIVDFSLGIDTVGGVRVPAGFCGIIGFRPSHGAISHVGIISVAPSLDAVGWFAKDPIVLRRVGHVLLKRQYEDQPMPRNIIIADDCFKLLKIPVDRVTQVVIRSAEKLFGREVLKHANLGVYLNYRVPSLKQFHNEKRNGGLKFSSISSLAIAMQLLQRHEFKGSHGEWVNSTKPLLDPYVSAQLHEESANAKLEHCHTVMNEMRWALCSLLKGDKILVIPTVAYPPPKLGSKEILSEEYKSCNFSLLSIASMSGCCQVSVPLGIHDKCPVSVSLIARHGGDHFLLDTVQTMFASLQEQADIAAKSKFSVNAISQEESAEIAIEKDQHRKPNSET